jgi:hypothetical protein
MPYAADASATAPASVAATAAFEVLMGPTLPGECRSTIRAV